VDHGTRAIRFSSLGGRSFQLPREEAGRLSSDRILELVIQELEVDRVDLAVLTYSMGDGLTRIVRIEDAPNRGLVQLDGAGISIGGGTRVYEALASSSWPVLLLPGIHRESDIDPRMKVFSHGMSPEKVGLAYSVYRRGTSSFIISDASSNTVTLGVLDGRIVGAIDAPIFAPGLLHGPLDVEAIRAVDSGKMTANRAFTFGGILRKMGIQSLDGSDRRAEALEALALFASMEIAALMVLLRDLNESCPSLFLAGSPAAEISSRVSELLGREVQALDNFAAARGCAEIACDVFEGADEILGIEVDSRVQSQQLAGGG